MSAEDRYYYFVIGKKRIEGLAGEYDPTVNLKHMIDLALATNFPSSSKIKAEMFFINARKMASIELIGAEYEGDDNVG